MAQDNRNGSITISRTTTHLCGMALILVVVVAVLATLLVTRSGESDPATASRLPGTHTSNTPTLAATTAVPTETPPPTIPPTVPPTLSPPPTSAAPPTQQQQLAPVAPQNTPNPTLQPTPASIPPSSPIPTPSPTHSPTATPSPTAVPTYSVTAALQRSVVGPNESVTVCYTIKTSQSFVFGLTVVAASLFATRSTPLGEAQATGCLTSTACPVKGAREITVSVYDEFKIPKRLVASTTVSLFVDYPGPVPGAGLCGW